MAGLDAKQREEICTKRRVAIVEWAADSQSNGGFRLLCEMCGISINGVGDDDVDAFKKASKKLRSWSRGLSLGATRCTTARTR